MPSTDSGLSGKQVLVTGAAGFIGSHLVERLVAEGAQVRAFVRYTSSGSWGWLDESEARDDFEVVTGDITDYDSVQAAARGTDVVFHLAALIGIPYSYAAPVSYVRVNVEGTVNVLRAARHLGVSRVIHTSTSEVYGSAQQISISESHPQVGQSPYSASKIGADQQADAFHRSFGLPVVTVRPFNTYGPRQSTRAVIPTIVTQLLAGGPVRIGSLTPTRDFNYVSDTVAGFVAAATADDAVGEVVNLGTGTEVSIGELGSTIARLMGVEFTVETESDRLRPQQSEVMRLRADNSKAQRLLGWEPTVDLDEGLRRTIDWLRPRLGRYRVGTYAV